MRIGTVAFLAMLLAVGSCATVPTPPTGGSGAVEGDLPIPKGWRLQVHRAQDLGREIYLLDKVSAISSPEGSPIVTRPCM
jgi:hypothetical protein